MDVLEPIPIQNLGLSKQKVLEPNPNNVEESQLAMESSPVANLQNAKCKMNIRGEIVYISKL